MAKKRILLIFGGRSGEHEVSLQSAKSIYEALDKSRYDVLLVGVDKEGNWLLGDSANYLINAEDPKLIALNKAATQPVLPVPGQGGAALAARDSHEHIGQVDVAFPIIHGTYGEDGSLQGLLELLDIPYVGAGVLGSAVGMDKDVMKRLLRDAGLPITDFVTLHRDSYSPTDLTNAVNKFGLPIFVKPANMGSSVGISKAKDEAGLQRAVEDAFAYDTKILLERAVVGREVEVAVLGNENPQVSAVGEIKPTHEFYDYESKYVDENGAELIIPADVSSAVVKKIQELAVATFKTLECAGLARVDFFVTPDDHVVISEINTLPGFTKISMYPKLWAASGIPYSELLDRVIQLAEERKTQQQHLKRNYE